MDSSLGKKTRKALKHFKEEFLRKIYFEEISKYLIKEGIITDSNAAKLKNESREEQNHRLWEILFKERDDQDIERFCNILKKQSVGAIKRLGQNIEKWMC